MLFESDCMLDIRSYFQKQPCICHIKVTLKLSFEIVNSVERRICIDELPVDTLF